jgi:predicted nucleic acid-binding protein
MTILDTDIVTLISYGTNEKFRERIEAVKDDEELAVTIITRMEILQGRFDSIVKAANEGELLKAMERFRAAEELLGSFHLLEINETAAGHFREMIRPKGKSRKGSRMKRGDMLIACIALAHEALLVTRNVDDYKSVSGLRVENWAD